MYCYLFIWITEFLEGFRQVYKWVGRNYTVMIKLLGALAQGKVSCQKTSGCTEQQMEHMPVEHPLDLRILSATHTVLGAQGRVWPNARHQAITFYPQASSPMKEEFSNLLLNSKH